MSEARERCGACNGQGWGYYFSQGDVDEGALQEPCENCHGTGFAPPPEPETREHPTIRRHKAFRTILDAVNEKHGYRRIEHDKITGDAREIMNVAVALLSGTVDTTPPALPRSVPEPDAPVSEGVPDDWGPVETLPCVTCPDCAFSFAALHVPDSEGAYTCPNCAEARLKAEVERLRGEPNPEHAKRYFYGGWAAGVVNGAKGSDYAPEAFRREWNSHAFHDGRPQNARDVEPTRPVPPTTEGE